jgi:hypothetical protein
MKYEEKDRTLKKKNKEVEEELSGTKTFSEMAD